MDRVWLITGAGRGLGRAFVQSAVRHGDKVIAGLRKPKEEDGLFSDKNVFPVIMDVTDKAAVKKAVREGADRFGRIDVLINNAGFGMSGAFEEVSDEELRALFETDYFGVANVTREVIPVMREQNKGMILSVSSQAGAMGYPGSSAYCSAKFAVVGLSEALGIELAPLGIQVSTILPGSFRTDFRDPSSMRFPQNSLEAYDGSAIRSTREFLKANNHKQVGDPDKAAGFIYDLVDSGQLPHRIFIGKKCCLDVKQDLLSQIDEIDSYFEASSETDHDRKDE